MRRLDAHQVSPLSLHPVPSLIELGYRARPIVMSYRPGWSPSTHFQATTKEEQQYPPMPPPRSIAERDRSQSGDPSQHGENALTIRHIPAVIRENHSISVQQSPPRGLSSANFTVPRSDNIQDTQHNAPKMGFRPAESWPSNGMLFSAPETQFLHNWENEYTRKDFYDLVAVINLVFLPRTDRRDLCKTLEAAKTTMLELLTEEEQKTLELEDEPAGDNGLEKIARQLDLIIPHDLIPKGANILPTDRMLRASKSYIVNLRRRRFRSRNNFAQAEPQRDTESEVGSVSATKNKEHKVARRRKKSKNKKGRDSTTEEGETAASKAQTSEGNESVSKDQNKSKTSKKRKQGSENDTDEEVSKKSLKRKKKKSTSHPIDDEITEQTPEKPEKPTTKKKTKTKPKKKKSSIQANETAPKIKLDSNFNLDTSFIDETLQTTEDENRRLAVENRSLRSMVEVFGVSGVNISKALTRMRHGQSAQEIFSAVKNASD